MTLAAVAETFPGLTVRENPETSWAVHDCGYRPLLTDGRLVQAHDPAWQMREVKNRDYGCLTERVRMRAKLSPRHRRYPGYELGVRHVRISKGEDYDGYPDFHIFSDHGDVFRELKRMGAVPAEPQVAVLTRLHNAGRDVGVYWPCCWYSGRIDWELAALARRDRIGAHGHTGLPPQPGEPGWAAVDAVPARPVRRAPRPRRPAEATSAERGAGNLAQLLAGPAVTGYVIGGGTISENTAAAFVAVRTWLREHGIATVPTPLRLVDAGALVYVQTADVGPGHTRTWREVTAARPFPDDAARNVAGSLGVVVTDTDAARLKSMIAWRSGRV